MTYSQTEQKNLETDTCKHTTVLKKCAKSKAMGEKTVFLTVQEQLNN